MSCKECEEQQNQALNKNISDSPPIVYVRVGNSNMALIGCNKHCKEVCDKIREKK